MAPIPIKRIVSVSSEDPLHAAKNLLWPGSGKRWLCAAENRSRRAEVELELCKRARIAAIDIANFGSAFVEVKVGSSELAPEDYITLLPQSSLRSVTESKMGRNRTKLASYRSEKLSTAAANQKWNRVRLVCRQPFHLTEQFGLQFVALHSQTFDRGSPASQLLTPPQTPTSLLSPPPLKGNSNGDMARPLAKLPHLPSNGLTKSTPTSSAKLSSQQQKTPRRPLRDRANSNEEEEFEFTGVERQSRLFQNALRGKTSGSKPEESNPILQKVISERKKYAQAGMPRQESASLESHYQRRKLLVKTLPKATGHSDFAASYEKGASSAMDVVGAFNRIAQFDNGYEIGTEPEEKWGWTKAWKGGGKRRGRSPPSVGQWLSKRKKVEGMISDCKNILERAGGEDGTGGEGKDSGCSDAFVSGAAPAETTSPQSVLEGSAQGMVSADDSGDYDSDATDIYNYTDPASEPCSTDHTSDSANGVVRMVDCPMCGRTFPEYVIELHASSCGEDHAPPALPGFIVID